MEIVQNLLAVLTAAAGTVAFAWLKVMTGLLAGIVLLAVSLLLILRHIWHRPVCACCRAVIDDVASRPGAFDE